MERARGAFIVIEGCDRCGKTTQCQLIVQNLNELKVSAKYLKFPERSTKLGILINKYLTKELLLDDYEIHLLFTLNRWEFVENIKQQLSLGTTLIVDRYSYSGVAYSAVKEGMDLKFCLTTEIDLPSPDLVIFLEGLLTTSAGREGFGQEIYEKVGVQTKVKKFFEEHFYPMMKVVNAEGSIAEVNKRLMDVVMATITGKELVKEMGVLTWRDLELLKDEDELQYKHVQDTIKQAVHILKATHLSDNCKLDGVLQLVRDSSLKMKKLMM